MDDAGVPRYWINTVSLDHVLTGVEGGFTQADHGRSTRLSRLSRGDGIAFYSPRLSLAAGRPLQCLTALGTIDDDEAYQVEMGPDCHPWRRRVVFEEVGRAPIRPLLGALGFITDEKRWGFPFRRGLFEVASGDFGVVAGAMRDAVVD